MAKQEKQQKKSGMFTEEQKQMFRTAVDERVAKKRNVRAVENAKGDYEKEQARLFIKSQQAKWRSAAETNLKNAGEDWTNEKKVQRELEKNESWKAWEKDREALEKGKLSDDLVLRYARTNTKLEQQKQDKSNREFEQTKMSQDIYNALTPDQRKAMGLTGNPMHDQALIANELFGMEYTQVGPAGVVTTDPKVAKQWGLNLKQGAFGGTGTDFPTGYARGVLNEYGNNYFKIFTLYPGFKDYLVADGVMTELPPISMSTEWGNSPAASIGEELDKALNNEFLEFCAMKTTDAQTPIMRRKDALTARCYVDSSEVSFQIKFRCYPGQQVGTRKLTTAKEWMLLLGMTTPINAACSFNVDNAIGTVVKAADGIAAAFKELKDSLSDNGGQGKNPQEKADSNMMVQRAEGVLAGQDTALESFQNTAARISNPNVFGACLFGVRIYPFIFKAPLTCYISSWSVTPSREWNDSVNDHYYYDFVLNCSMDQKPAAQTWWDDILKES